MFTCEHCKKAPKNGQWRRNWKWKTEKGFRKHSCYKDEQEAERKRVEAQEREASEKNAAFEEWMGAVPHGELGEEAHGWTYVVTKPTHEQRFNRMVRIRYEALR